MLYSLHVPTYPSLCLHTLRRLCCTSWGRGRDRFSSGLASLNDRVLFVAPLAYKRSGWVEMLTTRVIAVACRLGGNGQHTYNCSGLHKRVVFWLLAAALLRKHWWDLSRRTVCGGGGTSETRRWQMTGYRRDTLHRWLVWFKISCSLFYFSREDKNKGLGCVNV